MVLVEAAIQVGLDLIFIKFAEDLLGQGEFDDYYYLIIPLFALGIFMALF